MTTKWLSHPTTGSSTCWPSLRWLTNNSNKKKLKLKLFDCLNFQQLLDVCLHFLFSHFRLATTFRPYGKRYSHLQKGKDSSGTLPAFMKILAQAQWRQTGLILTLFWFWFKRAQWESRKTLIVCISSQDHLSERQKVLN